MAPRCTFHGVPQIPDHLELLLTDEPYLDLLGGPGPWRVPDGLFEEIDARIERLLASPAAAEFHGEFESQWLRSPAPSIVRELWSTLILLCGASAITSGTRGDIVVELLGRRLSTSTNAPRRTPTSWSAWTPGVRPPGRSTLELAGDDPERRRTVFALLQRCTEVFAGIEPLERRRHALLDLHQSRAADPAMRAGDLTMPVAELVTAWRTQAPAHVVAVIPELGGARAFTRHLVERLAVIDTALRDVRQPGWTSQQTLARVVRAAGLDAPPRALTDLVDDHQREALTAAFGSAPTDDHRRQWQQEVRTWLSALLDAGQVGHCRTWLDTANRLAGAIRGLPGLPSSGTTWLPVTGFLTDVRSRHTPRTRTLAAPPKPVTVLDPVLGRDPVGRALTAVIAEQRTDVLRRGAGLRSAAEPLRLLFLGDHGTGRTRAASWLATSLADAGAITRADVVRGSATELASGNPTAKVTKLLDAAAGGVLLLDDLHLLRPDDRGHDREAVVTLVDGFKTAARKLVVVVVGPPRETRAQLERVPALAALFQREIDFPDYTHAELLRIFELRAAEYGLDLDDGVSERVAALLADTGRGTGSENARLVRHLLDRAIGRQAQRVMDGATDPDRDQMRSLQVDDVPDSFGVRIKPADDPALRLARMIGLHEIKAEVRLLTAEARAEKLRREIDLPYAGPARHMVFTGNPGTAKTTVARLISEIYADLGLLSSGHLVEVSRRDLVGEYIGQTAPKVHSVVERALGGILFIDEAYALTPLDSPRDFGHEAVTTLVALMENYRHDFVVIAAGYDHEMRRFLQANSGLASRFPRRLRFPDYSDDELLAIFGVVASEAGFVLGPGVEDELRDRSGHWERGPGFGNGRFMRTLLEQTIARQGQRITSGDDEPTPEQIRELIVDDLPPRPSGEPVREVETGFYV